MSERYRSENRQIEKRESPSPSGFTPPNPSPAVAATQYSSEAGFTIDSSGNKLASNRSMQINRENDIKNVSVGLYDVDEAIYYYFENVIKPRVKEGDREIKVPVIYGSPERWKSVQKSGIFRDETGKIQFPILIYKRTSIERLEGYNKLDANNPNLFYSVASSYNEKNRYDQFDLLIGRNASKKTHNIVIPDYVKLSYDCILLTDFINHQNKVIEDINYASHAYWGKENYYKFLATLTNFNLVNEASQGEERVSRAEFTLEMSGYIIPDNLQKDMSQMNKLNYGVAKVQIGNTTTKNLNGSSVSQQGLAGKSSYFK
tara:strand:+ start:236 stop:1183 length:948 start_codon:yes stop_codon:yes gene_type:complete